MATPTTNNRLEKQTFGSNVDQWGVEHLNVSFDAIDQSLDGVLNIDITASANPLVISVVDYEPSDFRNRVIEITGFLDVDFVLTLPSTIDKYYIINNRATSGIVVNGRRLEQIGIYRLQMNSGVVKAEARAPIPDSIPLDLPVIITPSVSITPDLIGTTTYVDPRVTTEIRIEPSVVANISDPRFTGINQIIFYHYPQPWNVRIIGLTDMDENPLTFKITNGQELAPIIGTAPTRYLNVAMVPGTDKVFPVAYFLRGSEL